jgi:luciferase family oxidoreductase group 1
MTIRLSVLDQSLARSADEAPVALQETLQMARWCEALGYHRFWVSEHHAFPSVAGSAPEVLLAAVGAATQSIRIGSGGIMLPHYSPYKVAEVFSLLANLYPGRVDLGVGRAPGADMATAVALAPDGRPRFEQFPQQVARLSEFLWDEAARPLVSPRPPADLPLWMLGSSPDSAVLAAQRGLPYNLGLFINPQARPELIALYRSRFQPSEQCPSPYAIIAMSVFCADNEEQARALQLTYDLNLFRFFTGQSEGRSLTPQQALARPLGAQERAFIASRENSRAVGTPGQVAEQIECLVDRYQADEVMAVTNMYYLEDRKRSFELLMAACGA